MAEQIAIQTKELEEKEKKIEQLIKEITVQNTRFNRRKQEPIEQPEPVFEETKNSFYSSIENQQAGEYAVITKE